MSADFLTVEATASLLGLHPKTVLRHIRDGRLRATRVGRQYRILRSDLPSVGGTGTAEGEVTARATTVVDIDTASPALVERLSSLLFGALNGRDFDASPISLNLAHDPDRKSVKVIIIASIADTSALLRMAEACLDLRS